ncbi:MAG: hypothetical protein AAB642_00650 [Patescibacteria group bacterium]
MENNFLEERSKDVRYLERELDRVMDLSNKLVEGKRSFLIPTTTVSATIIAGLLIFMTTTDGGDDRFKLLAMIGAILFALSVVISHLYLFILLSLESQKLDHELYMRKTTLEDYKKAINLGITDPNEYSKTLARVENNRNEPKSKYLQKYLDFFSKETWFIISNLLFVIAFVWLFVVFLYKIAG